MKTQDHAPAAGCARLLCASQWTPDQSAVGALLARRGEWLQRAGRSGVRTALLYSAGWLVQWHEGAHSAVEAEWERVRADPRYRNARLLHRSRGAASLHDPVQLASLHDADRPTDVARRMHALSREHEEGWSAEPMQVWQALSSPCQLGRIGTLGFVARRDVVAVAAQDNEAVELVRLLAQERGVRMAYQRYAGSNLERADVGAAYADVPMDATVVTRVQALPRRALAPGVLLLGLRHVEQLLVLLGSDGSRSRVLLGEVEQLLRALPRSPQVQLVCRCPQALAQAAASLATVPQLRLSLVEAPATARAGVALMADLLDGNASQSERLPG
jgi:hypothetical protein